VLDEANPDRRGVIRRGRGEHKLLLAEALAPPQSLVDTFTARIMVEMPLAMAKGRVMSRRSHRSQVTGHSRDWRLANAN
jgi:hypothetical protein